MSDPSLQESSETVVATSPILDMDQNLAILGHVATGHLVVSTNTHIRHDWRRDSHVVIYRNQISPTTKNVVQEAESVGMFVAYMTSWI